MNIQFWPFKDFIQKYTTAPSRNKYADSHIKEIDVQDHIIKARVWGTSRYTVEIHYNEYEVTDAYCTCPYDNGGYCKHIINVLVYADRHLTLRKAQSSLFSEETTSDIQITRADKTLTLLNSDICTLSQQQLKAIILPKKATYGSTRIAIYEAQYDINELKGRITDYYGYGTQYLDFRIVQQENNLLLTCSCSNSTNRICEHLSFAINEIQKEELFQLPFNVLERHKVLAANARDKGWTDITDYDEFFKIYMKDRKVHIEPKINLLSYNEFLKDRIKRKVFPEINLAAEVQKEYKEFVVVEESPYSDCFKFSLVQANLNKNGTVKASATVVQSLHNHLKQAQNNEEIAFYSSFLSFNTEEQKPVDIDSYRDIFKNPLGLDFFFLYRPSYSGKINTKSLTPLKIQQSPPNLMIQVDTNGDYYSISCKIELNGKNITREKIDLVGYIFIFEDALYCLNNDGERNLMQFFKENGQTIFIQKQQFPSFKSDFLDPLENIATVSYSFIKPASKAMIKQCGSDQITGQQIYLSELNDFILITPTASYGDTEIPLLSKRTLYIKQTDGTLYAADRNDCLEQDLIDHIKAQHKSFATVPQTEFYYLHKKEFLDDGWFIHAFEMWRQAGFTIHGFNQIKNNRYSQYKISVKNSIASGIDWFDIQTEVSFGDQQVTLKQLQKSVVNKSRYIELTDGTQGILPQEWIEKFERYFRAGEIKDGNIRTHKSNFGLIDELFEKEILTQDVQLELSQYREKLIEFHSIQQVKVPKKLKAKLRDYQKEGLNWLNFLSEFNFGGCLADDMGLGKTIQIIAYILSQHEKGNTAPNLIVLPTSLLFNWQKEIEKFAPHLKYVICYGSNRNTAEIDINKPQLVLTTYGTLLSDISFLKEHFFNIIILDESQAIKNPESKRYKAVKLLNGRQRIVLTGTPVENNTFDLFAQLSFAMPGLLGTSKRFATDYSTPIDKFQDSDRAKELQQKIYPFVLRRTKKQVATELPPKTEIIHYCEMGANQRSIYEAYKAEFQKYLSGLDEEEFQSSSLHILQGITKLRQICNSPALLSDEEYYGEDSTKVGELIHQIKALKDAHKILVFSQFVGMLDLIKKQLEQESIGYAYLTGKTRNREDEVERFQEDQSVRVFLISLKAGGTGLNLTQAEYVFLVDPWWNPAVENQAIDRAYRIGQQNKVIAIRFIAPNSIEEKIMELQQRKRQLADELIQTDNSALKTLKKSDLINLL